jgi:hypothetical protein
MKLWEELIAYFPLVRRGPHRKRKIGRGGKTHIPQSDFISLMTKLTWKTQVDRETNAQRGRKVIS